MKGFQCYFDSNLPKYLDFLPFIFILSSQFVDWASCCFPTNTQIQLKICEKNSIVRISFTSEITFEARGERWKLSSDFLKIFWKLRIFTKKNITKIFSSYESWVPSSETNNGIYEIKSPQK